MNQTSSDNMLARHYQNHLQYFTILFHLIIIVGFAVAWCSTLCGFFEALEFLNFAVVAFLFVGVPILFLIAILFFNNKNIYWLVGVMFCIAILIEAMSIYRMNQLILSDDFLVSFMSGDPFYYIESSAKNIALYSISVGLMFRKEMKYKYY